MKMILDSSANNKVPPKQGVHCVDFTPFYFILFCLFFRNQKHSFFVMFYLYYYSFDLFYI